MKVSGRRWTAFANGRFVAERYALGYGVNTPLRGYSDTKSVISALTGILVRERRLSVDQPVPVPAWRAPGDPRHAITIDHLLRMTSGLAWREALSGGDLGPSPRMQFVERDMAGFAEGASVEAALGAKWNYNSGNTMIVSRIIRDAVRGRAEDEAFKGGAIPGKPKKLIALPRARRGVTAGLLSSVSRSTRAEHRRRVC